MKRDSLCAPVGIRHSYQEGVSAYQGTKRDVHQAAVESNQETGEGV